MLGILTKLFSPVITGVGSNIIRFLIISVLLGLGGFSWIKIHDLKVYNKAIKECPPQVVYTGNPTVINNTKKMRCFPVAVGSWGLGICHG